MATRPGQPHPTPLSAGQFGLILRDVEDLPTAPAVAAAALSAALETPGGDGVCSVPDPLEPIIRSSPVLMAQALRLAAEARGGRERRSNGLDDLDFALYEPTLLALRVQWPDENGPLDSDGLWRHSLAVALAAECLACEDPAGLAPADAWRMGLLHDLGKIALSDCFPKAYRRALGVSLSTRSDLGDCERRLLGTDHVCFGRRLAQRWQLGQEIVNVLWLHHQPYEALPESIPERRMIALVGLADAIARTARVGFSGNLAMPRTPAQLADQIQLPRDVVADVTAELPLRLQRYLEQLPLPAGRDPRALARLQGEANQRMGRKLADLRRRLAQADSRASAVNAAGRFAGGQDATSCLAETLATAAGAVEGLSTGAGDNASPGLYAIDATVGEVFLVRGARAQSCTPLPCRAGQVAHAPAASGASALAVLNRLLAQPEAVDEELRDVRCLHLPLLWGPRWVGGVLIPQSDRAGSVEAIKLLAGLLGPMIGLTIARDDALKLSDELAGASTALARTQDALAEQKTMRAVGEMAAGAAHELNTPLAVISGRAQLMRERAQADAQRDAWATVADQAQRISDIISDLMEFASPPAPRAEACSPRALVENAAQAFIASNHPQAHVVSFDKRIGEDLPDIWVDPTQIQGVILELITNAANASPAQAGIVLDLQRDDVARCVLLRVGDAGMGMDENTLASAYTPFFSMHRAGRRRGLGLPQAKRYVENNGGKLWITSQPECGTVATVQLPIAEVPACEGDYVQAEGRYPRR